MGVNPFKDETDLQAYLQRARTGFRPYSDAETIGTDKPGLPASDEPESVLQGKIVRWAKEHGYPIQSNRQTRNARGLLTPGWPDVCLILRGRVVFIELKSGKGRLSEEQKQLRIQFMYLGHEIYECRSWKRFEEIVRNGTHNEVGHSASEIKQPCVEVGMG